MFSCFSPWHGLRRLWKRLVTVIFWGESAGISGKIHCDLPEGSTGRFTGTKRSVTTAGDSGHQFQPWKNTPTGHFCSAPAGVALAWSRLRVFRLSKHMQTDWIVSAGLYLFVPVVLLLRRGNKDSCDHAHAHGGLQGIATANSLFAFFCTFLFQQSLKDNTELLPDSAEARKTKELNGVQRDFD